MLVELSVANYRCFRDRVTLSLEAEPRISERDKAVDERNIAHTPEGDLLRVVGIYGANASGKSNLLRALSAMRSMVLDSAREGQAGDRLPVDPFRLDEGSVRAPTELEVVFVFGGVQYRYGLAATVERVEREWMFVRTDGDDEQRWFERDRTSYEVGPGWQQDASLEQKTRAEALHLSVAAAFNHPQATSLLDWFRRLRIMTGIGEPVRTSTPTARLLMDENHGEAIRALIRRLDFGIDDLKVTRDPLLRARVESLMNSVFTDAEWSKLEAAAPPHQMVVTIRNGVEFDMNRDESAGTAKAFELAGPIVEALAGGDVVVIDELDARLHTLLAKQIVELFQDPATNPHDAQLVFASHDTNLLTRTLLRRDQLWFVEKSRKTHSSDLYSLAELRFEDGKGVRNDARYEADYLQGRYGAIPFFGNLHAILGEALKKEE
jgi:energy-coupling factor transporter ATP-binding protein EcfA2